MGTGLSPAYDRKAGLTQDELREETAGGKVRKHRSLQQKQEDGNTSTFGPTGSL